MAFGSEIVLPELSETLKVRVDLVLDPSGFSVSPETDVGDSAIWVEYAGGS